MIALSIQTIFLIYLIIYIGINFLLGEVAYGSA